MNSNRFIKLLVSSTILLLVLSCQSTGTMGDALRRIGGPPPVGNSVGFTESQLIANYGQPQRRIDLKKNSLFYYENNMFYLENGVVSEIVRLENKRYIITVESYSRDLNNEQMKTVDVISGVNGQDSKSLEFEGYTSAIRGLIRGSKNFSFAKENEIPDVLFVVNYGISDPIKETRSYSTPIFSWQPNTIVNSTYYNSNGTYGTMSSTANDGGLRYHGEKVTTYDETNYNRYFVLTAVDARKLIKEKKVHELWKVIVTSHGPSGNLKNAVSAFIMASYGNWGIGSEQSFRSLGYYNDPGPDFLK